jgi:hypothetical protein
MTTIVVAWSLQIRSEEEFEERVNFKPMTDTLVRYTGHEDRFTRVTAMEWLSSFIKLGANKMIVVLDQLVGAIMRCWSNSEVRPLTARAVGCIVGRSTSCAWLSVHAARRWRREVSRSDAARRVHYQGVPAGTCH